MRTVAIAFSLITGMLTTGLTGAVIVPQFLQGLEVPEVPFKYNGLLHSDGAIGSASLVGEGVIATAAHVIFDDENLTWIPQTKILYYPKYHQTTPFSPSGTFFPLVAFIRWENSYPTRVENDDQGPGLSSIDTFNIDFAVGYMNQFANSELLKSYPEVNVDAEEIPSILRHDRTKMIVGYPADTDYISSSHRGLMHKTQPGNYFCFWSGLEDLADSWRDTENYWVATYEFEGVTTYSGNSGGPIYVMDDEGNWVVGGVVVGSVGSEGVLVRGIDENAYDLIQQAVVARNVSTVRRVTDLTVSEGTGSIARLEWTDNSTGETGYRVHRLDEGLWNLVAELGPDTTSWIDSTVYPGRAYRYTVQPLDALGNPLPQSPHTRVRFEGADTDLAAAFGQPWLTLNSDGDSNWFLDTTNRLRAGKINPLSSSTLRLSVIGPGTLSFDWRVSSEVNPLYGQGGPDSDNIFDAVYLFVDGAWAAEQGENLFLSGITATESRQLTLSEGPHTVEWIYDKDPYSSEGDDTAYLEALQWTPDPVSPYPVLGAYAIDGTEIYSSSWFGTYRATGSPWIGHLELGWLYMYQGDGYGLWLHSANPQLGKVFTHPDFYPYLYSVDRGDWLFYFKGSGANGGNLILYDFKAGSHIRINE